MARHATRFTQDERARRVVLSLRQGVKLTEALEKLDETGEFRWRLTNALQAGRNFLTALHGWLESLDAKAFQQEQAMAQSVTTRINDLSTKRLLPFEMILQVMGPKPASVRFLRAQTVGLYGLSVEAESTSPAGPSAYQSGLSALPAIEKVEVREQRARDNLMTFTLAVTFRPETVKAGSAP